MLEPGPQWRLPEVGKMEEQQDGAGVGGVDKQARTDSDNWRCLQDIQMPWSICGYRGLPLITPPRSQTS